MSDRRDDARDESNVDEAASTSGDVDAGPGGAEGTAEDGLSDGDLDDSDLDDLLAYEDGDLVVVCERSNPEAWIESDVVVGLPR